MDDIQVVAYQGNGCEGTATLETDTEEQRSQKTDDRKLDEINNKLDLLLSACGIGS